MTYLKGAIYVSNTAPFIKKNPWDYISSITSQIEGESTIPLSDADIKVFMGGSSDLICRGLSSDEGEFYLRVPSGINCFIEVYMNQKLILIKHLQVSEKREMKVGSLDIESTAEAILLKKKLLTNQDQPLSPVLLEKLYPQIEYCWKNGISLHKLYDTQDNHDQTVISKHDPFQLITSFNIEIDEGNENLFWSWATREPCQARLFYRSFRSRHYRQVEFPEYKKRGFHNLSSPQEFEGYVYYLEVQTQKGFLALTPPRCFRIPIKPRLARHRFIGRQEGPVVTTRNVTHGKKTIQLSDLKIDLLLKGAIEKSFESEMNLEFVKKIKIPRFILREGFHELELNIYFPQDHSFLWGPIETPEELSIDSQTWEKIKKLWAKFQISAPSNSVVEIGYSKPFSEIISYRNRSHYRLFSNMDLSDTILILSYRSLDTLNLDCMQFFLGQLNLQGEGQFSDYHLQLKLEGRFFEEKSNDLIIQSSRDIYGQIDLDADMVITANSYHQLNSFNPY